MHTYLCMHEYLSMDESQYILGWLMNTHPSMDDCSCIVAFDLPIQRVSIKVSKSSQFNPAWTGFMQTPLPFPLPFFIFS